MHTMHSESDSIEIMIGSDVDGIIEKRFNFFL